MAVPGADDTSLMLNSTTQAAQHLADRLGAQCFRMSGTSMAAALMLADSPSLTPDQVKYRLMALAHPAVDANGNLAYSIFQQGADRRLPGGDVDRGGERERRARYRRRPGGETHYGSKANRDAAGN